MLAKRIIPCLDVKDGRVVKGVNFVGLRDAGDPVELAKFYSQEGADEIVFLDITATSDNRDTIADVVRRTCREVFVPVTVGGGIRTVDDFRDQWIDFPEFLSYLPTLRSQSYDSVLATAAVQEMRDSHAHYYFQIDAVLREGEPIPLERLRGTIRRILFNQRKGEIIRAHEEELCARASEMGEVKIFADEKPKKDE